MKKLLSIIFALCAVLGVQAANSLVGTSLWGYYTDETINTTDKVVGIGLSAKTSYKVVMRVPCEGVMTGATIMGVNLPIRQITAISDLSIIALDEDKTTVLDKVSVSLAQMKDMEFNAVAFSKPISVDHDIYVGCQFTVTDISGNGGQLPVLVDKTQTPSEGCLMYYNDKWNDNSGYGVYIMQVYAKNMKLGEAVAQFSPIEDHSMVDSEDPYEFTINSDCQNKVTNIDYAISINGGEEETRHAWVSIPSGLNQKGTLDVSIHSPKEVCTYSVKMRITKVNGVDNQLADQVATSTIANVDRELERNVVMEEFTGTGCGNCTRGFVGMKHCYRAWGDRFVGIALHRYNSSDPMYLSTYDNDLYFGGAPDCYLDRVQDYDPYYGDSQDGSLVADQIVSNVTERMDVWAPVAVKAEASIDDDMSEVTVKATIDPLCQATYKVVYVLTADSLYSKTWKQTNYLYSSKPSDVHALDTDKDIAEFCNGGKYGQQYCNCYFNDVAVASSYVSGSNRGGTVQVEANTTQNVSYKLNMPTKAAVYDACIVSKNLLHACVLLIDKDGHIANATRCSVKLPTGIDSLSPTIHQKDGSIYDLNGRKVSKDYKGLKIVNGKLVI